MFCIKCGAEIPNESQFCSECGNRTPEVKKSRSKRGNGQGSVYKEDDAWTACVVKYYYLDADGKRKPKRIKKKGFRTKREALECVAVLRNEKIKKVQTLQEYWEGWSTSAMLKKSDSKQTAYKIARTKLQDIFYRPIDTLTINNLQNAVDAKAATYYPARDMKSLLSHLYKRAVAQGDVLQNLSAFITLPELEETEKEPFNAEEQNAMWALYAKGDPFVAYILLMIYTGMMPGELRSAKKNMIDWDKQQIVGCGKKTKKRKETPIVVPDIAIPVLKSICERVDTMKLLSIGEDKFYEMYYACLERAGCRRLTPYSCRHTTGTALGVSNVPLAVAKEIMRHTKITTTQRYIHVDTETMLAGANRASKNAQNASCCTSVAPEKPLELLITQGEPPLLRE